MLEKREGPLTLEKQLASFQDIDPIYRHLYATWQTAKDDLANILRNILLIFPHYSLHDASHSEAIIHHIEAVLGEKRIAKLQPTEIWLFLMSTYTHDLGMLVRDEEVHKFWKEPEFAEYLHELSSGENYSDLKPYADLVLKEERHNSMPDDWPVSICWAVTVLTADYFRRYHPTRSEEMIRDPKKARATFFFDFSFQNFIRKRFILLLGKIASLHGKSFADIFSLSYCCQGMGLGDDLVYPRRIAEMLRLGDLLDMDNGRFDKNVFSINGVVPETTLYHQEKDASLYHFLVNPECIEVAFDCPDEDAYQAASDWVNWLKEDTQNLALHWNEIVPRDFGSAPMLKSADITLNGEKLTGDVLKRFDFSNDTVFELLEGANIYSGKFSCFRELIQNAEDATKLRLWEDLQSGEIKLDESVSKDWEKLSPFEIPSAVLEKYKISLEFSYDSEKKLYNVKVQDHGSGINDAQLKQMEKVANSWHERKDSKKKYKEMPAWLNPTGAFGIGLQSVFRLTDILECESAPRREAARKIIFRSRRKGGRISNQKLEDDFEYSQGTTFSFNFIFPNDIKDDDLLTRDNLRHVDLDPFQYAKDKGLEISNLYYLLGYVIENIMMNTHFFPIEVILKYASKNKKIHIFTSKTYNIKLKENKEGNFKFFYEWEKRRVVAYDEENCITYNLTINLPFDYIIGGKEKGLHVFFKGMKLNYGNEITGLHEPYKLMFHGSINLEGFSTRNYLTLSREKIRQEKEDEVKEIVKNDIIFILSSLLEELYSKKNLISQDQDCWLALASFLPLIQKNYSIPKEKRQSIKNFVIEQLQGKLSVKKFIKKKLEEFSLLKKEFFSIILGEQKFWMIIHDKKFLQKNIDLSSLKNLSFLKDKILISNESLQTYFDLSLFKVICIYKEKDYWFYQLQLNTEYQLYSPKVSREAKKVLNQFAGSYPRIVTYSIQDYEALAVTEVPSILKFSAHYAMRHVLYPDFRSIPCAITPFNNDDIRNIQKISDGIKSEELWQEIEQREDFKNLVKYVKEYNLNPDIKEEKIRIAYKQWIEDIVKDVKEKD